MTEPGYDLDDLLANTRPADLREIRSFLQSNPHLDPTADLAQIAASMVLTNSQLSALSASRDKKAKKRRNRRARAANARKTKDSGGQGSSSPGPSDRVSPAPPATPGPAPAVEWEELESGNIRYNKELILLLLNNHPKCPQSIIIPEFSSLYISLILLDASYPPRRLYETTAYTFALY
jgi:hypothetical protein